MIIKKVIFASLGFICLFLGALGIIVPGLPTTPFLLLTSWFFIRSSDRLYNWLINHKLLGAYLNNFQNGMSLITKLISIGIMWTMIFISVFIYIDAYNIQVIVLSLGVVGTVVMSLIKQPEDKLEIKIKLVFKRIKRRFKLLTE